jgi:tRNA pseudouridine13 synthase
MEKNSSSEKEFVFNNLSEEEVGISEYVNIESTGFNCILKHRYSDFLVNEIDEQGNVVWLKKSEEELMPNKEEPKLQNSYIQNDSDLNSILREHFFDTKLIKSEEDLQSFKDFIEKYLNDILTNDDKLLIDYIEDKNDRKIFHEKIRKFFEFLDSETLSDSHGISSFSNKKKKKANDRYKNKRSPKKENTKLEESENPSITPSEPFEKKMQIFINRQKSNMYKKRNLFPDGSKKVLHFSMMKRNMDTVQAITYLARMIKRSNKTIKFAGNKDKRGITTQRISAYSTMPEEFTSLTKKHFWDKRIELGNFEYRSEELRLGSLKGNQFSVVFRFIEKENLSDTNDIKIIVENSLKSLEEKGFLNYFGMQRFGVGNIPTHKVGLFIIQQNYKNAVICILHTLEIKNALRQLGHLKKIVNDKDEIEFSKFAMLLESENVITDLLKIIPKYSLESRILKCMKKTGKNSYKTGFNTLNKQLRMLYPHAYQSYIWNLTVSDRIRNYGMKILLGDIVKKRNSSSLNEMISEDVEEYDQENSIEEQKSDAPEEENEIKINENEELKNKPVDNIDYDKIFEENYEYVTEENISNYSFEDLYFPVVGSKIKYPKNESFNFIISQLEKDKIKLEDFAASSVDFTATGHFRKVVEKPKALSYYLMHHDNSDEDLQTEYYNFKNFPNPICLENKYLSLRLQFQLPQSTYATMLFRELTKKSSAFGFQSGLSSIIKKVLK